MGRLTRIEEPARGAELAHEGKPLGFADVSHCGGLPRVGRRASPILTARQASPPMYHSGYPQTSAQQSGPSNLRDVRCGSKPEVAALPRYFCFAPMNGHRETQ